MEEQPTNQEPRKRASKEYEAEKRAIIASKPMEERPIPPMFREAKKKPQKWYTDNRVKIITHFLFLSVITSSLIIGGLMRWDNDIISNKSQKELLATRKAEQAALKETLLGLEETADLAEKRAAQEVHLERLSQQVKNVEEQEKANSDTLVETKERYLAVQQEYLRYVQKYRRQFWLSLVGNEEASLELKDGKVIEDFTIREVTEEAIRIKMGYSYRTIERDELSEKTLQQFFYNPQYIEEYVETNN